MLHLLTASLLISTMHLVAAETYFSQIVTYCRLAGS